MNLRFQVLTFCSVLFLVAAQSCQVFSQNLSREYPRSFVVEVSNPLKTEREEVMVLLKEEDLKKNSPAFNSRAFVVLDGKTEIPSQYVNDAERAGIVLVLDKMKPAASRKLTVRYKNKGEASRQYTKRTQAELSPRVGGHFENRKYIGGKFQNVDSLRVPDEHTDHSYYIRYEGPGWESDKVGYRYYLDWRNATDVFGKKTNEMILQEVGQDGFDSYHNMQPWGMDVLKVGKSLGVGSLALFHDGNAIRVDKTDSVIAVISENGDLYSSITTKYYNWKVADQVLDLRSLLSIHAGSRLTHHQVAIEEGNPQNLSTGLGKDKTAELLTSKGDGNSWGFLASYGKQSLNQDQLGIAVLFRPKDFIEFTEDANSHIVKLKPSGNKLEYYFLAAWELEKEGIKSQEEFLQYLEKTARELANPVKVSFVSK